MNRTAALVVVVMSTTVAAQWLELRDPATPRTKDGRPNLLAPAPHTPDGKPELSGVWAAEPSEELRRGRGAADPLGADLQFISKYALNLFSDFKPGEEPIRPEAAVLLRQRMQTSGRDIPTSHCLPGGVPFSTLIAPFKIIQTPRVIVLLLEDNNPPRQVHMDGRKHPPDPWPAWMGYSVGRWEGDTLVVDTTGFNERSWVDAVGHPRSETMHVVERFRRRDFGHIDLALTVDDPKMYTRPVTVSIGYRLLPDTEILESICAENERDRVHIDH